MPCWLDQQQLVGGDPGGQDDLDPVPGCAEHGLQCLIQLSVGHAEGLGVDHVLEVVQQQHRPAAREGLQQSQRLVPGAVLGVLVELVQPLRLLLGQ